MNTSHNSDVKVDEPVRAADSREQWQLKHRLSRRTQRPLVELNLLLAEAAKQGVLVNITVERIRQNAPFIDASVYSECLGSVPDALVMKHVYFV